MRLQPSEPASEWSPVAVHRIDTNAFITQERCVGEDETEAIDELWMREEGAKLGFEDEAVDAAAVEAEDAWEGERGRVGFQGQYWRRSHAGLIRRERDVPVGGVGFRGIGWWPEGCGGRMWGLDRESALGVVCCHGL